MNGVVVDTSAWIDFFAGAELPPLADALARGIVVLPPIVIAELVSGARRPADRRAIADLVLELTIHDTPPDHWVRVGTLRRELRDRGLTVSTPDAHVAQCALDRNAPLLTKDHLFARIAELLALELISAS
ncbi:MAG TPA: PIN domain-containing protein [Thermoanaerobaculia bacterium]